MARAVARSAHVSRFLRIIEAYEKKAEKDWHKKAERVVKRYADHRPDSEATRARYNVLWSNVETLKPFLYSSTPKPIVQCRVDEDDKVAAITAEVLEKALTYSVAEEHFGSTLRYSRDDYLLTGRGTGWVRYVPHIAPAQIEDAGTTPADQQGIPGTDDEQPAQPEEVLEHEETIADFVHWKDFGHTVARTWEEVDCVWRRVRMSRSALVERFGEEIGNKIPLNCAGNTDGRSTPSEDRDGDRAEIYELWCKSEKRVVWLSKGYNELCDDRPDPLKLAHFFPTPRPIYATLTTDSLMPIPDYIEYQDQALELDDLTARIDALTDAVKAAGVYDASVPALERLLQDGHDNTLIPVEAFATLVEKGGLKGAVELLPMQDIAETLILLYKARDAVKADLYEITGMSDIIRGNTAPEETATAQKIKSNFATRRLEERQREVERFARNLIDIMGNVIANQFSPETLAKMTGVKLIPSPEAKAQIQQALQAQGQQQPGQPPAQPPVPQEAIDALHKPTWAEVMQLLRDQPNRRFRIDVETDSMVAADDQQEQAARTQFLETAGQFLNQAVQAGGEHPELVPLLGQMLMFGVRGFRVGRDLEDAFEEFVTEADKKAKSPTPPPPSPEMMKVQGQLKLQEQAQQFDQQQRAQQEKHDQAMERSKMLHDQRLALVERQNAAAAQHGELQASSVQAMLDVHGERVQAHMDQQFERWKALLDSKTKIEVAEIAAGAKLDAAQESAANQGAE